MLNKMLSNSVVDSTVTNRRAIGSSSWRDHKLARPTTTINSTSTFCSSNFFDCSACHNSSNGVLVKCFLWSVNVNFPVFMPVLICLQDPLCAAIFERSPALLEVVGLFET